MEKEISYTWPLCARCFCGWAKLPGVSEENGPTTFNSVPIVFFKRTLRANDSKEQFECREGQLEEYAHDDRQ